MSNEHTIENLMTSTMQNIRSMIDVNTIVGDAVETKDGSYIIPISKVSFGFASGGSDFQYKSEYKSRDDKYPFGGGCGAGVTVKPVAFLVVRNERVVLLPVDSDNAYERLFDAVPQVIDSVKDLINKFMTKKENKKAEKESAENISININETNDNNESNQ